MDGVRRAILKTEAAAAAFFSAPHIQQSIFSCAAQCAECSKMNEECVAELDRQSKKVKEDMKLKKASQMHVCPRNL